MRLKKIVYTWDYRMRWVDIERPFIRAMGGTPYLYGEEIFLKDYKLAVDFLSEHGFDGIIIWGLLRDSHGGVKAANKLCDYASSKGMRIIAGVGVNGYGGIYWEGNHEFNIDTWLRKRPELAAVDIYGKPIIKGLENLGGGFNNVSLSCPSRSENEDWNLKGVDWLINTIRNIGGIWFESSDYGLCQCHDCQIRGDRSTLRSIEDDELIVSLVKEAYSINNNLWLFGDNSRGFWPNNKNPVSKHVWDIMREPSSLPDYAIKAIRMDYGMGMRESTHSFSLMDIWKEEWGKMMGHTYGFVHYSSLCSYDEDFILIERIKKLCTIARKMELVGVSMYGELGNFSSKINYMALEAFSNNSELTVNDFQEIAR